MKFSPIILFAYNRPEHLRNTIESLLKCKNVEKYSIYFFSDGPKSEKVIEDVRKVREILKSIKGFKSVEIVERPINFGLAKSVITGITDVLQRNEDCIVLEDDLEFSENFLDFMNEGLELYKMNKKIFSLGGYTPKLEIPGNYLQDVFLSYRCCTWGWATWKDRWDKVDWDIIDYNKFIRNPWQREQFNRGGRDMTSLLTMQMEKKIDSWGIRWDYAHYKNRSYCLRPIASLVNCTGLDGSGVHCGSTNSYSVNLKVNNISLPSFNKLKLNKYINFNFARFYDGQDADQIKKIRAKAFVKSILLPIIRVFKNA